MKSSRITALIALFFISSTVLAQTGSDKLDVQALEQKYWAAKDDDFSVVQNRAFQKKGRFFGTLHFGSAINDPYYSGTYTGVSAGYFFNESWGLEGTYQTTNYDKSRSFKEILRMGGGPKANEFENRFGINGIWTPIYAKMSLFDRKIIHFDMGFTFGLTQINYSNPYTTTPHPNYTEKAKSSSTMGYSIGVMQQFYFSEKAAVRIEFNNTFSTQDTVEYGNTSGAKSGTKNINDTSLLLGITIFDWRSK